MGWKGVFLVSMALGLVVTAACARGVPQADYDKVKADLATVQGQANDLQTQLGSAKASLDKANSDLAQAKADSDKAKTDLAQAQTRVQSLQTDNASAIAERDKARNDLLQVRADSDKAKADLAAAQARAQRLEGDLSLSTAQANDLQTQLGSAKASLDKAKADQVQAQAAYDKLNADYAKVRADLQTALTLAGAQLPEALATVKSYAKIVDLLFLEAYRQQLGLEAKYQYADAELRAEVTKAVQAANDPVLTALWVMGANESLVQSFGVLMLIYEPIAVNSILGEGITPTVFPPAAMAVSPSPASQTLLQIKLVNTDGKPVPNMGMALWRDASPSDRPDGGVAKTDASGIASFTVKEGVYWTDFNPDNPLTTLELSSGRMVRVTPGMLTQVEIQVLSPS